MNQRLKLDVYCAHGDESLNAVFDTIRDKARYIRSGQKRLVWAIEETQSPYVFKIPYNKFGIMDNAVEVLFYKTLVALRDGGQIQPSDLELFTSVEIVGNDLFKIKCERAEPIESAKLDNQTLADSIMSNINYTNDYQRIQQILGDHFVAYDATIYKEPMNFGFIDRNGRRRLVLIDAGSILPKVNKLTNVQSKVTCPQCGSEMYYQFSKISDGYDRIRDLNLQKHGAAYVCSNQNCVYATKTNITNSDLYVYDKYLEDNRLVVDAIIATYTGLYIPDTNGMPYSQYRNLFLSTIGSMGATASEYEVMVAYSTYVDSCGAFIMDMRSDIVGALIDILARHGGNNHLPYFTFAQEMANLGINLDPLYRAWTYISSYLGNKDTTDSESWARFMVVDGNVQNSIDLMRSYMNEIGVPINEADIATLCNDLILK